MPRRILHLAPGPTAAPVALDDRAVAGAWFELHRQGGCGAGELRLADDFPSRFSIHPGEWIAFDHDDVRWYLGRVESVHASSPVGVTLRLEGMGIELNEVFPGGFSRDADGAPPHRYANTDLFFNDPDYASETLDSADAPHDVVALLASQYVAGRTHITVDPDLIEPADPPGDLTSLKFRGEESVRAVLKDLALRARNAAWGVDQTGTFFFLRPRPAPLATWREGRDLISLEMTRERDLLFNRILLTGDYVYDAPVNSEVTARGFYRWRGNYIQPASRDQYGERRIRLWTPWIRTASDSRAFAREFFRVYAQPAAKYLVEVAATTLPRPWLGAVRLEDRDGNLLVVAQPETIRVRFDHIPRLRLELGPEDPRVLWPEPPHDERWEVPAGQRHGGDQITSTTPPSSSTATSDDSSDISSDPSSDASSDPSSDDSSNESSDESSNESGAESSSESSDAPSDITSDESSDVSSASSAADNSSAATSGADSSQDQSSQDDSSDVDSSAPSSDAPSSEDGETSHHSSTDQTTDSNNPSSHDDSSDDSSHDSSDAPSSDPPASSDASSDSFSF